MSYRIEYAVGHCNFVNSGKELIEKLKSESRTVTDVRKLYKSGVSDSVMEKYERYIQR